MLEKLLLAVIVTFSLNLLLGLKVASVSPKSSELNRLPIPSQGVATQLASCQTNQNSLAPISCTP